jgi:hypothetical protein
MISAADGGTVSGAGVEAKIPPGALAADLTVTVNVLDKTGQPDADSIAAPIFDFGPNGTTFLKPVEMTIDFTGAPPAGMKAVIAFLKDGKWEPLADSAVTGSKVTATTTHFTPFTVVFVSGQGQTGGGCAALQFTPCGGALEGTWKFEAACADANIDPFMGMCPGATFAATVDVSGTVTFTASSYTVANQTVITTNGTVPKSCLGGAATCPMAKPGETWTDTGDTCTFSGAPETKMSNETGTLTVSGTQFTTANSDGSPPSTLDYCVTGNQIMARDATDPNATVIYKATKQ